MLSSLEPSASERLRAGSASSIPAARRRQQHGGRVTAPAGPRGPRGAEAPGAATARPGWRRLVPSRAGVAAYLAGVLSVFFAVVVVNNTGFADRLVDPLMRSDTSGPADAIVVLGAGMVGNCEPNIHALRRVMLANQLYRAGRAPILFFTGGPGAGLPCSVATVMADLAADLGVPRDRITIETTSRSTHTNAALSAPLLRSLGARRLLIVTDRLHMPRAEASFLHYGFATERASVPVYQAHPNNVAMLMTAGREYLALGYYSMRGWLTPAAAGASTSSERHTTGSQSQGASVMAEGYANPGGPIVILGASYAGGWKLPAVAGRAVINKGMQGQQSWELAERFDRDVLANNPRAVIVWGFINDIFRAPAGSEAAAIARAKSSIEGMIDRARAARVEPILATEVTIRPQDTWSETIGAWAGWIMGKTSYQDRINTQVEEVNDWLRLTAQQRGVLVLDLQPVLAGPRGERRAEFSKPDGSHITDAGYQALSAYATPVLEKHFTSGS
jgi:uncharacterized SAM-binding protein YcdF (DUF218 family)/lysophospholipase L1-like esterase